MPNSPPDTRTIRFFRHTAQEHASGDEGSGTVMRAVHHDPVTLSLTNKTLEESILDGPGVAPPQVTAEVNNPALRNAADVLAEHDMPVPASILNGLLDFTYTNTVSIGLRRPELGDAQRLYSGEGDPAAELRLHACPAPQAKTLLSSRLQASAEGLLALNAAYEKARRTPAQAGKTARQVSWTLVEQRDWTFSDQARTAIKIGKTVIRHKTELDIRAKIAEAATMLLVLNGLMGPGGGISLMPRSQVGKLLDDDANANAKIKRYQKSATKHLGSAIVDLSGLSAMWQRFKLTETDDEDQVLIHDLWIPFGLVREDGTLSRFNKSATYSKLTDAPALTTEGWHIYRMMPKRGLSAPVAQEDGYIASSRKRAQQNHTDQRMRDIQLLGKQLRAGLDANGTWPAGASVVAPRGKGSKTKSLRGGDGVRDGALLVMTPKDDVWDVHLFDGPGALDDDTRAALIQQQQAVKDRNRLTLSLVSYIAGRLYSDPTMRFIKLKSMARTFHPFQKVLLAGTSALVMVGISLVFPPLWLAIVGVGFIGLKRLFTAALISNPEKILRKRSFLSEKLKLLATEPDANMVEAVEQFAAQIEADEIGGAAGARAAPPAKPFIPETSDKDAYKALKTEADRMMTGDVGDILRRAFVHFLRAAEHISTSEDKDPATKLHETGRAMHHLEKGWRYMGPATIYMGLAWNTFKEANAIWSVQSGQSTDALMEDARIVLNDLEKQHGSLMAAKGQKGLLDALAEELKPNVAKRGWYRLKAGIGDRIAKVGRTEDEKITYVEQTKVAVAARQQKLFEMQAFHNIPRPGPSERSKVPEWEAERQIRAEVGGPEVYAKWQIRGGSLEPYGRKKVDLSGKPRALDVALGERTSSKVLKSTDADLRRLGTHIGERMDIYAKIQPQSSATNAVAPDAAGDGATAGPLNTAIRNANAEFIKGWRAEDKAGKKVRPHSKFYHVLRNWSDKRTGGEKAKLFVASAVDLVPGIWVNFGFGCFDSYFEFKPTKFGYTYDPGRALRDASAREERNRLRDAQADLDIEAATDDHDLGRRTAQRDLDRAKTAEEIARAQAEYEKWGDARIDEAVSQIKKQLEAEREHHSDMEIVETKAMQAANRLTINTATATVRLLSNLASDEIIGKIRGDTYTTSEILSDKAQAARDRGAVIASFLRPNAPRSDDESYDARNASHAGYALDPTQARAGLKTGAAYVGSNLTKRIGANLIQTAKNREQILLHTRKVLSRQAGTPDPAPPTLTQLVEAISPYATYHAHMSRLEVDLMSCLTYLNLLAYVGSQIEDSALARIGMAGHLQREIPWKDGRVGR